MNNRVLKSGKTRITQGFSSTHKAVDLGRSSVLGETIIAHTTGVVIFCQTGHKNNKNAAGNASYGNCVKLDHGGGYTTVYAHLASVSVKRGDTVKAGQELGTMGNTGRSFGMHLHFEVRLNERHIDPTPYLTADLPIGETPSVRYRAYAGKWLPDVTDCHDRSADGYAGVSGKPMTALQAVPSVGTLRYRVHRLGKGWLPWVENDTDFAGVRGYSIDAVQMQLVGTDAYDVQYRVSPVKNGGWYGFCTGLTDNTGDGYAGVFGNAIDCIQVKLVRKER